MHFQVFIQVFVVVVVVFFDNEMMMIIIDWPNRIPYTHTHTNPLTMTMTTFNIIEDVIVNFWSYNNKV